MKIYATFGLASALAASALTFALYLLGFHSDPAKVGVVQTVTLVLIVAISATCIVLGTRARRATVPLDEDFGYGRALGAGAMISLFAALFGIVTNYLYMNVVNPDFAEVLIAAQREKWEAANLSARNIEGAEAMMRKMLHPAIQAVSAFVGGFFFGFLVSLVTSAFLKRPAVDPMAPPLQT